MAKTLSDYTLEEMKKRLDYKRKIVDYSRTDYHWGATLIGYKITIIFAGHLLVGVNTFGMLTPFTLAIAAARQTEDKTYHYFHTESGILLGNTRNESAERAYELALEKMREKKYSEASSFFNVAYNLCEEGSVKEQYKRSRDEAAKGEKEEYERKKEERKEAEDLSKQEKVLKLERKEKEGQEREKIENENLKQDRIKNKWCEERRKQEMLDIEQEAEQLYIKAGKIWNDAFNAEFQSNADEASKKFKMSHEYFSKAHFLVSSKALFRNWVEICALKIEGNVLFNEGLSLQEEGKKLREMQKYEEALEKYKAARAKYIEALDRSGDSRFESCIDVVNECMKVIHDDMRDTEINKLCRDLQMSDTIADEKVESPETFVSLDDSFHTMSHHALLDAW